MSEIAMGLKNRSEGRVRKAECLERGMLGLERGKGRKALPIVTPLKHYLEVEKCSDAYSRPGIRKRT